MKGQKAYLFASSFGDAALHPKFLRRLPLVVTRKKGFGTKEAAKSHELVRGKCLEKKEYYGRLGFAAGFLIFS